LRGKDLQKEVDKYEQEFKVEGKDRSGILLQLFYLTGSYEDWKETRDLKRVKEINDLFVEKNKGGRKVN